MWETAAADAPEPTAVEDLDAAVDRFHDVVRSRGEHGAEDPSAPVLNLAAAAALTGGLKVDPAQLSEPVVLVPALSQLGSPA